MFHHFSFSFSTYFYALTSFYSDEIYLYISCINIFVHIFSIVHLDFFKYINVVN